MWDSYFLKLSLFRDDDNIKPLVGVFLLQMFHTNKSWGSERRLKPSPATVSPEPRVGHVSRSRRQGKLSAQQCCFRNDSKCMDKVWRLLGFGFRVGEACWPVVVSGTPQQLRILM